MLHKQPGKEYLMVRYDTRYHSERIIFWISPFVNSRMGSILQFCNVVYPSGKPEDFRSCVVKGSR